MANTEVLKVPCPCIDCICKPICRHKPYLRMIWECSLIKEYIPDYNHISITNREPLISVESALNPITWRVKKPYTKQSQIFFNVTPGEIK